MAVRVRTPATAPASCGRRGRGARGVADSGACDTFDGACGGGTTICAEAGDVREVCDADDSANAEHHGGPCAAARVPGGVGAPDTCGACGGTCGDIGSADGSPSRAAAGAPAEARAPAARVATAAGEKRSL
ncbi:hypothetical protein BMAJHU_I0769 [Burkholderia mallei JHU]|nr:hypothetical protein BMAJHU_I0769 [Burkholderia mallei JHU]